MEAPVPAITLDDVAAAIDWLVREAGTIEFSHDAGKCYASVAIVDDDREGMSVTVCVDGGGDSPVDITDRLVKSVRALRALSQELIRVPF